MAFEIFDGILEKYTSDGRKEVIIPDGVTTIGEEAFSKCQDIVSVIIPDGVTSIENEAFCYCCNLESVSIPDSVTSIGKGAFSLCEKLIKVRIPESVSRIETETFSGCKSIKELTIPESVSYIGSQAFRNCESIKEITIPKSVTNIEFEAFAACSSATKINIHDKVTNIGEGAFICCESIKTITIPNSVTSIEKEAFCFCTSLTEITIPDSVTSISYGLFENCSSLKNVTLPDSITNIGYWAFNNCSALEKIVIPASVTEINGNIFEECNSLVSIEVSEDNKNYAVVDGVLYDKSIEKLICYPQTKKDKTFIVPDTVKQVGDSAFIGAKHLEELIFKNDVKLEPYYHWNIRYNQFIYCNSLKKIQGLDKKKYFDKLKDYIPAVFKEELAPVIITGKKDERSKISCHDDIAQECLNYLNNNKYTKTHLTNLAEYFYRGREVISAKTFSEFYDILLAQKADKALELIPINVIASEKNKENDPDANLLMKLLGEENDDLLAFEIFNGVLEGYTETEGVTEVIIPDNVTEIESGAFAKCKNIVSVKIPKSVTDISEGAFNGCIALKEIIVEEGNENYSSANGMLLHSYIEWDDNELTEIVICPFGLTEAVIPKCVNTINLDIIKHLEKISVENESSFFTSEDDVIYSKDKTHLVFCSRSKKTLDIPDTVTSIDDNAFYECKKLTSVNIPDSVTSIGKQAFSCCDSLTSVTIPDSIHKLGNDFNYYAPFRECANLKSVKLPAKMEYLGVVFWGCKKLEDIDLPHGITAIEKDSFYECESLKKIVIPDGVEIIRERAFSGCKSLSEIIIPDSVKNVIGIYSDNSLPDENGIIYADKWAVGYREGTSDFFIREGTVGIRSEMFGKSDEYDEYHHDAKRKFGKITIPASMKYINLDTFRVFSEVEISEGNEKYSSVDGVIFDKDKKTLLFYPMEKPEKVYTVPDGVEKIGIRAFMYCKKLKKVIMPEGLTEIGVCSFMYTSNLTEIELPYTVKKIGESAFVNYFYQPWGEKVHDHSIYIYLCKDDIKIPFELLGNWKQNAEENTLNSFFSADSVKRKEYCIEKLKSTNYKIPLALFITLTEPDAVYAKEYVRKNIKKIAVDLIDKENNSAINKLLELGLIKDIDSLKK